MYSKGEGCNKTGTRKTIAREMLLMASYYRSVRFDAKDCPALVERQNINSSSIRL